MQFWKEFFSPSDSYGALQTLLWVNFLLGLAPFRIRGVPGNRRLSVSWLGYLSMALQVAFFLFCFTHSFVLQESIVGFFFKSEISRVGDTLQKFIGMLGMLTLFGISLEKCRDVISLYNAVARIDARFLNLGVVFCYRYIMKLTHLKLFLVIGVNVAYLGSSMWLLFRNDIWPSFQAIVTFFVPHLFLLSVVVLYSAFVMRLQQHFLLLNKITSTAPSNNIDGVFKGRHATAFGFQSIVGLHNAVQSCLVLQLKCRRDFGLKYLLQDLRCPRNLYAALRLLIIFVFFSHPPRRPPQEVQNSSLAFDYFSTFARFVFYNVTVAYNVLYDQSILTLFFRTTVSRMTDSIQKFNVSFCNLATLVICYLKHKRLEQLIACWDVLEQHFIVVGVAFLQKRIARRINRILFLTVGPAIGYLSITQYGIFARSNIWPTFSATVAFYSSHIVVFGVTVLFNAFTFILREHLHALNKVLKNLGHQWDNRTIKSITHKQHSLQCLDSFSMYTIVTKDPSDIIQESMEIHHMICDAASTANKYFTYQLLTIISIAFLIIVFDAYYVLETLLGKSKRESKFKTVEFVTFFSCQMVLYLIAIISIVEGSNRAIKKSEKTGGIVHSLLNKTKSAEVKEKLQQFSLQLMHLKINFTAAGLFNIDRTLYFTISGALTTYLIILLQFTSNTPQSTAPAAHIANTTLGI